MSDPYGPGTMPDLLGKLQQAVDRARADRQACTCAMSDGSQRRCPVHGEDQHLAAPIDQTSTDTARLAALLDEHQYSVEERVSTADAALRDYGATCTCGSWNALDSGGSHRGHVVGVLVEAGVGFVAQAAEQALLEAAAEIKTGPNFREHPYAFLLGKAHRARAAREDGAP